MTKEIIPVMHCFDNNYALPAAAAFYSLLENSNNNYFYKLYVLNSDISLENQNKLQETIKNFDNASLEFININTKFDDLFLETFTKGHFTKDMFLKFIAPSVFMQYEKIIISDVDVIYLGDISKEFIDFNVNEDFYLAAVKTAIKKNSRIEEYYQKYDNYFSQEEKKKLLYGAGYLIFNLKKMREDNIEEKFIKTAKENAYRLMSPEQDVINLVCYPKIKNLPLSSMVCNYIQDLYKTEPEYNCDLFYTDKEIKEALLHPIQFHYAQHRKPWNDISVEGFDKWIQYIIKTPFFNDWIKLNSPKYDSKNLFSCNFKIKNKVISLKAERLKPKEIYPVEVSILCCCYNQKDFIKDAIESVLSQNVYFPIELIIADDCSTDGTQDIIREYALKYPKTIKPILRTKNVGIGINYYEALSKVRGKYLAILDGDDVWIDNDKLKKQYEFLESNKDYTICCSNFKRHFIKTPDKDDIFNIFEYSKKQLGKKKYAEFNDLLNCSFIASCTVMMRWSIKDNIPEWFKNNIVIDLPLNLIHASKGKIKLMPDILAQYNIHENGISRNHLTKEYKDKIKEILLKTDEYLNFKYTKKIKKFVRKHYE